MQDGPVVSLFCVLLKANHGENQEEISGSSRPTPCSKAFLLFLAQTLDWALTGVGWHLPFGSFSGA